MKTIFERAEIYKEQLAPIEATLLEFANTISWNQGNYGRKPRVGIFGKIQNLDGNILVEAEENIWMNLPDLITPKIQFILWSSSWQDHQNTRLFANAYLYWATTFDQLQSVLPKFLFAVQQMHRFAADVELIAERGKIGPPDCAPNYGGIRQYRN